MKILSGLFFALLALTLSVRPLLAADDIVIGYHGPMTGPASWVGLGGRDGALLALNEINAAGGVNGRKLRMVAYDDADKPSEAEAVAKKLIESDKAFVLLGGVTSNTGVVVAEEAKRSKVPYLNGSAASPKIMDTRSKWVFSGATIDVRDIAENEAAFIGTYLKPKKVAILQSADEFSQSLIDAEAALLTGKYGVEIVNRQNYNRGDTDFSSQLLSIRRTGGDLLLLSGPYIENARIVRQARELGLRLPIKGDTSSMNSGLLTIAGPAAEGMYVSFTLPYFNGDPAPDMVKFEQRYKAAYPSSPADRPNYVDMYNYGNMYVIAEALKRAGPNPTPKGFVEAMETLDGFKPSDFLPDAANIILPITFTRSHNGNRRMAHFVVKGGKFTRVTDFSAPEPSTVFPADDALAW